eukprot:10619991-Alexandrium_andersonii.AAC.1
MLPQTLPGKVAVPARPLGQTAVSAARYLQTSKPPRFHGQQAINVECCVMQFRYCQKLLGS